MRQYAHLRMRVPGPPPATSPLDDVIMRARLSQSMRRRMSDDLVTLIRRACLCGHADTAKGLWIVLRELTLREAKQKYPNGRVPERGLLESLAMEIAEAAKRQTEAD